MFTKQLPIHVNMSSSQIRKDIFDNIRASEINYVTMLQYIVEVGNTNRIAESSKSMCTK